MIQVIISKLNFMGYPMLLFSIFPHTQLLAIFLEVEGWLVKASKIYSNLSLSFLILHDQLHDSAATK